jgi:COPI associated protein
LLRTHHAQEEGVLLEGYKLPSRDPVFMGMQLLYMIIVGLLIVAAEIRVERLKATVLQPFGFLQHWLGRGFFYIFVATLLIPVRTNVYAIAIGAMLLVFGFAQVGLAVFLTKRPPRRPQFDKENVTTVTFDGASVERSSSQASTRVLNPIGSESSSSSSAGAAAPPAPGENPFLREMSSKP